MIEILIVLVVLVVILYFIVLGSTFITAGMAYGYWGLSIGMAPVLWLFMIIGAIVGFICALKNAFKAVRAMKKRE